MPFRSPRRFADHDRMAAVGRTLASKPRLARSFGDVLGRGPALRRIRPDRSRSTGCAESRTAARGSRRDRGRCGRGPREELPMHVICLSTCLRTPPSVPRTICPADTAGRAAAAERFCRRRAATCRSVDDRARDAARDDWPGARRRPRGRLVPKTPPMRAADAAENAAGRLLAPERARLRPPAEPRAASRDALLQNFVGRIRINRLRHTCPSTGLFAISGLALLRRDRPDARRRRTDHGALDHRRRAVAFEERHQRLALAELGDRPSRCRASGSAGTSPRRPSPPSGRAA